MSGAIAVPTLGATTLLTDPSQILAYLIRQFCTTPRSISTIYYDYVVSLGDIISRTPTDSQSIVTNTTSALSDLLTRIFGSGTPTVDVTVTQINDALYSLVISIQVVLGTTPYGVSSTVQVNNGVLVLNNDTVPPLSS